jgi:CubicO group peptidase (beta-lactamase class C family)
VSVQAIFQKAADDAVAAGEAGIQIAVYKDGELVADVWSGVSDESTGQLVDGDTLFSAFSCCKAVTNAALHLQAARGLLDYDAPVAQYWPEFGVNGKDRCTVRDVLSHRAGVPQMPEGVTPALMADFDWMTRQLASMAPLYEPGTTNGYHNYTQGWLSAELVQRTDPEARAFRDFVYEEIAAHLGMNDMYYGLPAAQEHRVAKLYGAGSGAAFGHHAVFMKTIPAAVDTTPEVWEESIVRRSCIPGAGAHFTARSEVRFWAMLAEGGTLNGARLFSPEQIRSFSVPRPNTHEPDCILDMPIAISTMGFWLAGSGPAVGSSPHLLAQTGAGNSIAWADPDNRLAVAVTHNRFGQAYDAPLANAIRDAFGIE